MKYLYYFATYVLLMIGSGVVFGKVASNIVEDARMSSNFIK